MDTPTGNGHTGYVPLVVVLGASGFIGSAVVVALSERPIRIRAVGRTPDLPACLGRADIEVYATDLTRPGEMERAIANADVIIHLVAYLTEEESWRAAEGSATSERVNAGLTGDLVEALAKRADRRSTPPVVLFAGSTTQVGVPPGTSIRGDEPDAPRTVYDAQKTTAEKRLQEASRLGIARAVTLRLSTVYGTSPPFGRRNHGVLASMVRRAFAGQELTVWGDGTMLRDFMHLDDAADAFVHAMDYASSLSGRHWLVGREESVPLRTAFEEVASLVSQHSGRPEVPVLSVPVPESATPVDLVDYTIDATAFRSRCGWAPKVSLTTGLRTLVADLATESR